MAPFELSRESSEPPYAAKLSALILPRSAVSSGPGVSFHAASIDARGGGQWACLARASERSPATAGLHILLT
jgi:hypothetical protein